MKGRKLDLLTAQDFISLDKRSQENFLIYICNLSPEQRKPFLSDLHLLDTASKEQFHTAFNKLGKSVREHFLSIVDERKSGEWTKRQSGLTEIISILKSDKIKFRIQYDEENNPYILLRQKEASIKTTPEILFSAAIDMRCPAIIEEITSSCDTGLLNEESLDILRKRAAFQNEETYKCILQLYDKYGHKVNQEMFLEDARGLSSKELPHTEVLEYIFDKLDGLQYEDTETTRSKNTKPVGEVDLAQADEHPDDKSVSGEDTRGHSDSADSMETAVAVFPNALNQQESTGTYNFILAEDKVPTRRKTKIHPKELLNNGKASDLLPAEHTGNIPNGKNLSKIHPEHELEHSQSSGSVALTCCMPYFFISGKGGRKIQPSQGSGKEEIEISIRERISSYYSPFSRVFAPLLGISRDIKNTQNDVREEKEGSFIEKRVKEVVRSSATDTSSPLQDDEIEERLQKKLSKVVHEDKKLRECFIDHRPDGRLNMVERLTNAIAHSGLKYDTYKRHVVLPEKRKRKGEMIVEVVKSFRDDLINARAQLEGLQK